MTTLNSDVLAATTSGPVLTLILQDRTDREIVQSLSLDIRDHGPAYGTRTLGDVTVPFEREAFFKTVMHYLGTPAVDDALIKITKEGMAEC